MADVDGVRLQMNEVEIRGSSARQTPLASFGEQFKAGLSATANVVGNAAASAGYAIPGAAVVGAAITGMGTVRDTSGGMSNVSPHAGGLAMTSGALNAGYGTGINGGTVVNPSSAAGVGSSYAASGGGMTGAGMGGMSAGVYTGGGYMDGVANRAAAGDPGSQMMMATQQMQEMNQTFNLQYLQLQEKMQAENRQFTALSNVMKTKQDTAKNSLSNLK